MSFGETSGFAERTRTSITSGSRGAAASLHFNAVLPRALFLEYNVCENPMLREIIRNPVQMDAEGFIPVPQGPGLGIEVDEKALRRFQACKI